MPFSKIIKFKYQDKIQLWQETALSGGLSGNIKIVRAQPVRSSEYDFCSLVKISMSDYRFILNFLVCAAVWGCLSAFTAKQGEISMEN